MKRNRMVVRPIKGYHLEPSKDAQQKMCKITTHQHLVCQNNKGTPLTVYTHLDDVPKDSVPEILHIPGMYIMQQSTEQFGMSSPLFGALETLFDENDVNKLNTIRKTIHTRDGYKQTMKNGPQTLKSVGDVRFLVHRQSRPTLVAELYDTFETIPIIRNLKTLMAPTEQKISNLLGFETLDDFRNNCMLQIAFYKAGQGLHHHIDSPRYGNGPVITVGMGRENLCYDTYQTTDHLTTWPYRTDDPPMFRIPFHAGDIVIFDDDARYNWTHAVPFDMPDTKCTFIYRIEADNLPYSIYRGFDPILHGHTVRVFETSVDKQGRNTISHTTQKSKPFPKLPELEHAMPTIHTFTEKVRPLVADAIKTNPNTSLSVTLTKLQGIIHPKHYESKVELRRIENERIKHRKNQDTRKPTPHKKPESIKTT